MPNKMSCSFVHIFSITVFLGIIQCSLIEFSASPSVIKTNLTSFASMRCSLTNTQAHSIGRRSPSTPNTSIDVNNQDNDVIKIRRDDVTKTSSDVTRISSFTIRRNNGEEVAFATFSDPPTAAADLGNLEVKGEVSGSSSEGYIELTWRDASSVALGEYTCEVAALEAGHHIVQFTSTLELTSETPAFSDIIEEFKSMRQRQQQQEHEISIIKQENKLLHQTVDKLKQCAADRVSFTAVLSHGGQNGMIFAKNATIVFDKTIINEGGAYNNRSGQFVCNKSGTYEFSAHGSSSSGHGICLHLNINSATVTSFYAYDTGIYPESGSTSAVVHLNAGDVVETVSSSGCQGGAVFFQNADVWQSNVFTGHLIHSDECFV